MKIARFFAVIFGIIGTVLLIGSVGLCVMSRNASVRMTEVPEAAVACSKELADAISGGDLATAGSRMYGQPDLGVERLPDDVRGALIWDAFVNSLTMEFTGACYATDTGIARDAVITVLDVPSVTEKLNVRAHALLTARVENAEDMAQLYDETNNFREDLVEEVLTEAVLQALAEDAKTVTREVTLALVYRDNQWWVVPDQTLLTALTGGVA